MRITKKKYLQSINPLELLRTKKILRNNPTIPSVASIGPETIISLFEYDEQHVLLKTNLGMADIKMSLFEPQFTYWLNIDVLHTDIIEDIGKNLSIHPLIIEDILSKNQRPKLDEIDEFFTCILNMLYFNDETKSVESEQVSFVLCHKFLISFQDDAIRDVFNPIREKLKSGNTRIRQMGTDYLLYALLDIIVDHYFEILDKLAIQIEQLEEEIAKSELDNYGMNHINDLRKEIMFLKRNISPVRELIGGIVRSDHPLIKQNNIKYFKDIYDHIIQANDLCDTYREIITNIRDLHLSQMNLKMNEVMKFLAIVTALLAPATVIGGIFGMNFDRIPYLHHENGFWLTTAFMIIVPIIMLFYFRKRNWF
jgi:magnesium transporter